MQAHRDKITLMNPWEFVVQDHQTIADRKDQAFGRMIDTWYETIEVDRAPYGDRLREVVLRIFTDNLDNLYVSAALILRNGRIRGHATRVPLAMTSHDKFLEAGDHVDVSTRHISESNMILITEPLIARLESDYLTTLSK